jgi:hypothetical protein
MSFVVCGVSALSVALVFYLWRSHDQKSQQRQQKLRERVTYMLWVMANTAPEH